MSETGRIVRGRVVGEVRDGDEVEVELLNLADVGPGESYFRVWPAAEVPIGERCRELHGESYERVRCDGKALHRARFHWHIDTDSAEAVMWVDRVQQQAERVLRDVHLGRVAW